MPTHTLQAEAFVQLYRANLIPLNTVLAALVWVLYDFFMTIEDEISYIWTQKRGFGKFMYFWIRYYTIFLVAFDTLQIHTFAIPGVVTLELCLAADPTVRIAGAISLWSVQLVMQLRIYVLFNRSRRIALLNGTIFASSIIAFLIMLTYNAIRRRRMISGFVGLPLKGCPVINGGIEWLLWVPAMVFELVLFGFAIRKSIVSTAARTKLNERRSLVAILLHENFVYFFIVTFILFFNNLMVIGATRIPWFGFAPFHAGLGITISRMMIHLRTFAVHDLSNNPDEESLPPLRFLERPETVNAEQSSSSESIFGSELSPGKDENMAPVNWNSRPSQCELFGPQAGPSVPRSTQHRVFITKSPDLGT